MSPYDAERPEWASISLLFADGSRLRAEYWRVIQNGRASISSFDHKQKYGLPAEIDAIKELQHLLHEKILVAASLDVEAGDLNFEFSDNTRLQVLNFTGYEVWELRFPDGAVEYSNYAK